MRRFLSIVMVATAAHAQSMTDEEASARLSTPVTDAVSVAGVLSARLTRRHCFGAVCLAPGVTVSANVNGTKISVVEASSPEDFEVSGFRFAANSTVAIDDGRVVHGALSRPVVIGGLQVAGQVALRVGQKPALVEGTLARPATVQGWLVPAGFLVRPAVGAEWSAEATDAAAPDAVMVRGAKGEGWPARARAASEGAGWRGATLVEPLQVGTVVFGPGTWSVIFMPDGRRQYSGHLDAPLEAGVLRVERGAFVYWCDRDGLQEAQPGEVKVAGELFAIADVAFTAEHLHVLRSGGSVAGHKAETCTRGAISGYEVDFGATCFCGGAGGGPGPTLKLDSSGRASGTNRSLRREADEAKRRCTCDLPPGVPPPP